MRLEREERATTRLAALTPKRTGVKAIRADQGRLDRQHIHSEESSVGFSRSIGMEYSHTKMNNKKVDTRLIRYWIDNSKFNSKVHVTGVCMLATESSIIGLVLQPPTETSYHVAKAQTNPTFSLWHELFTI